MDKFIGLRCLNRVKESNSGFECRHILAGVSLDTLEKYDFAAGPFVEIRYCVACNVFWRITIQGLGDVVEMEVIDTSVEGPIPFLESEEVFSSVVIKGRKIKGGRIDNTLKYRGK